jgi:CDP-diacylglycerol--glycerol-3-phosphate 3-phosphatidyltransferase
MHRYPTSAPPGDAGAADKGTRTTITTHTEDLDPLRRSLRQRITDAVRGIAGPIVRFLVRIGVTPNAITLFGFALAIATCALIIGEVWPAAFAVFFIGSVSDMFDGSVARLSGKVTRFGAFLDSTLDRTAEGLVLGAIGIVFARDGNWWALGACFLALTASFLVSYTRARAEGIGIHTNKGGLMSRPERLALTGLGLLLAPIDHVLEGVIYVMAVLTTVTVAQRVVHVWRELKAIDAARPGPPEG